MSNLEQVKRDELTAWVVLQDASARAVEAYRNGLDLAPYLPDIQAARDEWDAALVIRLEWEDEARKKAREREKAREKSRRRWEANPEKAREKWRKWREANREKELERSRKWREANPEKAREAVRRCYEKNREKARRMKEEMLARPVTVEEIDAEMTQHERRWISDYLFASHDGVYGPKEQTEATEGIKKLREKITERVIQKRLAAHEAWEKIRNWNRKNE